MKEYKITMTEAGQPSPYHSETITEEKLFNDLPRTGRTEYTYTTANNLLDDMMRLAVDNAGAEDAEEAERIIKTTIDDFFKAIPTEDKEARLDELHALQWLKGNGDGGIAIGSNPVKLIQEYFLDVQDAESWDIGEA